MDIEVGGAMIKGVFAKRPAATHPTPHTNAYTQVNAIYMDILHTIAVTVAALSYFTSAICDGMTTNTYKQERNWIKPQ